MLASRSPQRRAILERLGIEFRVCATGVAELAEGDPEEVARENALRKARTARARGAGHGAEDRTVCAREVDARGAEAHTRGVAARAGARRELVLGCDTLVVLDRTIYGKPADAHAARAVLSALGGVTHEVISGLALLMPDGEERVRCARTSVTFRALGDRLLDWYLATGEWRGRAGGYAIQGAGAALVRSIAGDYENVVGLPLATLLDICPELLP